MKKKSRNRKGFTIVELLIVIVVVGILAAITVVGYNNFAARAGDARRASEAQNITKAIAAYHAEHDDWLVGMVFFDTLTPWTPNKELDNKFHAALKKYATTKLSDEVIDKTTFSFLPKTNDSQTKFLKDVNDGLYKDKTVADLYKEIDKNMYVIMQCDDSNMMRVEGIIVVYYQEKPKAVKVNSVGKCNWKEEYEEVYNRLKLAPPLSFVRLYPR